jgi:hypothetical protein
MKLLRIIPALFLIHFSFLSQGQTITQQLTPEEISNRLVYVYGNDFLSQNPELITTYGQVMNQYIEYMAVPLTNNEKYPLLSSVPLMTKNNPGIHGADLSNFNPNTFNPMVYQIDFFSYKTQVYRINTNYIMVVRPIKRN